MASTFSQTLRLELIGDGDQSGIWGQTTNTNLGTLLEQAITGVVSITMTDANYTLTNFNGVSDEARNAVLVVGGTNSQVRDIIAPLVEKLYVIRNNTVGGFGVRIIGATGTGVTVPSGATVWVYCDGTNFNAIGTESIGNFEVNGNLTVTGNTNAAAATYTGNVAALNFSTANVSATGNVSAANFSTSGNVSATGNLSVTGTSTFIGIPTAPTAAVGTNTTQIATTAFVQAAIPSGVILLWSGSIASIPSGWLLCNGSNGTPDLRDRFVVGAGSTYAVGATGGATTVTLSTTNLPSHTHSISASGTTSTVNLDHLHDISRSGTTSGQSTGHTHAISDPGHGHFTSFAYVSNNPSGPFDANASGTPNNRFENGVASAFTGITGTQGVSNDHTHTFSISGNSAAMNTNQNHNHTVTVTGTSGATGSGTAFSILPPYYALAYIMKS